LSLPLNSNTINLKKTTFKTTLKFQNTKKKQIFVPYWINPSKRSKTKLQHKHQQNQNHWDLTKKATNFHYLVLNVDIRFTLHINKNPNLIIPFWEKHIRGIRVCMYEYDDPSFLGWNFLSLSKWFSRSFFSIIGLGEMRKEQ
jgi:hypothetical protein